MTEDEAFALLLDKEEPVARAMFVFRTECARMEQAEAQRKPPSPKKRALLQYEAVAKILAALGHTMPKDPIHMDGGRWWFWDETWTEGHGPYDSRDEAKAELDRYCREVLGQP